ncbi:hypothetical protein HNQ69_001195 [Bartonella callosciuri]|uniref:Uncharacterized protein n=1 Tax=Bartonella callosciuri TaxID=686223 RepID=A0A840NSM3_9HYPH|nr:hypothetical protein [Bartonella callosciuri]MBB5074061.1 hypothetical protein [Bartonella callosciuri]
MGIQGIACQIKVNFYAPASNLVMAKGQLEKLSDDKQTHVGFDGHRYEFVSRVIGGNDFTYETVPAGS